MGGEGREGREGRVNVCAEGREQSNLTAAIVSEMFAHQSLSEHVRNGSHDPWLPTHLAHIMGGILNPNRDLGM
jgi:hypothetical protein